MVLGLVGSKRTTGIPKSGRSKPLPSPSKRSQVRPRSRVRKRCPLAEGVGRSEETTTTSPGGPLPAGGKARPEGRVTGRGAETVQRGAAASPSLVTATRPSLKTTPYSPATVVEAASSRTVKGKLPRAQLSGVMQTVPVTDVQAGVA